MAGAFDFTGKKVSFTYQRLLQISGTNKIVLDGTGSLVPLTVSGTFIGDGSQLTGIIPAPDTDWADSGSYIATNRNVQITGSVDISGSLTIHELELFLKTSNPSYYVENIYAGNQLSTSSLYDDSSKTNLFLDKKFTYQGGQLTQSLTTRYSDNKTLTKVFVYSGNSLVNVTTTES